MVDADVGEDQHWEVDVVEREELEEESVVKREDKEGNRQRGRLQEEREDALEPDVEIKIN